MISLWSIIVFLAIIRYAISEEINPIILLRCILNWPNLYLQGYPSKAYVNIAHKLMETNVYGNNVDWTENQSLYNSTTISISKMKLMRFIIIPKYKMNFVYFVWRIFVNGNILMRSICLPVNIRLRKNNESRLHFTSSLPLVNS